MVTFNGLLTSVYQQLGARIADVFSAFQSADFTDQVTLPPTIRRLHASY